MLTGYAQMLGWCDALMGGRPPPEPADWGRPATAAPGLAAAGRRRKGEEGEEEEERKVLSQQHEWIQTGGREGEGKKGYFKVVNMCKHKGKGWNASCEQSEQLEWMRAAHATLYENGLKDRKWRKKWKRGNITRKFFWESIRRGITKRLRELCMMNNMREVFRIVFRICCIFRLRLWF